MAMPVATNKSFEVSALIGLPPKTIPLVSIISFLLMGATLYYLFFEFRFIYYYDGFLATNSLNNKEVVVTISQGKNLSDKRTNNWIVAVMPKHSAFTKVLQYRLNMQRIKIQNNSFTVSLPQALSSTVRQGGSIPCSIRLTSTTLMEKVW